MSSVHVIIVHGIRVADGGESSLGPLREYFLAAGADTAELFGYGRFGFISPRWQNDAVALDLTARVRELREAGGECIVVAHSNGCTVTHIAGKRYGLQLRKAVYLNPALNHDVRFPSGFKAFDVWHNPHDKVVRLSRWLPWHVWGDMGARGYTRHDPRGRNFNMLTNFQVSSGRSHSVLDPKKLETFGPIIAERALEGSP